MYKVKISGYYKTNDNKKVDYNNETVIIPDCREEAIQAMVINRVVDRAFSQAKQPYLARGKCYIDNYVKDDKMKPSYEGKNLKELSWDELEDLAIAYDLEEVPLFRSTSLREARVKAYRAYCNVVKGANLSSDFDFANAADIVLGDVKETRKAE